MTSRVVYHAGRPLLSRRQRNIAAREAAERGVWISVRAMRCGRGCAHGRAFHARHHIRLYLSGDAHSDTCLLIHELAHLAADAYAKHDDQFYAECIRIAKREGMLYAFLNWQGRRAKAAYRRLRDAA